MRLLGVLVQFFQLPKGRPQSDLFNWARLENNHDPETATTRERVFQEFLERTLRLASGQIASRRQLPHEDLNRVLKSKY